MNYDDVLTHLTVPYLPLIGSVHPDSIDVSLLADLFDAGLSGEILPYDKASRWQSKRQEKFVKELCTANADYARFVTRDDKDKYRIYYYSTDENAEIALAGIPSTATRELITFSGEELSVDHNSKASCIYLKELSDVDVLNISQDGISPILNLPPSKRVVLAELATDSDNTGFSFLAEMYASNQITDPGFMAIQNNKLLGAIAPLTTLKDNHSMLQLLPSYFGVKSEARHQGIGTHLWNAAMDWAVRNNAKYLTLQAAVESPANLFYQKRGLTKQGYVIRKVISADGS